MASKGKAELDIEYYDELKKCYDGMVRIKDNSGYGYATYYVKEGEIAQRIQNKFNDISDKKNKEYEDISERYKILKEKEKEFNEREQNLINRERACNAKGRLFPKIF